MSFRFRFAIRDDIAAIHALVESAYRGDAARIGWTHEADLLDGQRTDPDALAELLRDPDQRMILAETDDDIAGCVAIERKSPDAAYLGMLTVRPDWQARGLGRLLMAEAEMTARALFDADAIEMTVIRQRGELIAYYERRGYCRTGEARPFPYGDTRFGVPRTDALAFVVLAKPLR
ncbi:GNAT family N-acetyltransferase [Sphingomonas sp.]|uniref:GNAT family N-acetyltransferase n=1 Tax=Sphingomonas sp. TaxID=28214 RepID=UPI002C8084B4|nr:GNAT family N-acetyltransferase [Sphingomonas sp.]HTG37954.1 GNAT family N-acetyltransferase [Sphingomonas sp.]